jgi:hypothetical protein
MIKLKTSKELGEVFRKLLQIAALLRPPAPLSFDDAGRVDIEALKLSAKIFACAGPVQRLANKRLRQELASQRGKGRGANPKS